MGEAMAVLYAVVMVIVAAAAIFTGIDVFLALENARGRGPKYFDIRYRYEYGTEFCRAHLAGEAGKLKHKALYLIGIHPKDAAKAYAWTVMETELRGAHLLRKGKFYKTALKEELYD